MIDSTAAELGVPDIVFNNAGISPSGRVTDISEAEWDECLSIDSEVGLLDRPLCAAADD